MLLMRDLLPVGSLQDPVLGDTLQLQVAANESANIAQVWVSLDCCEYSWLQAPGRQSVSYAITVFSRQTSLIVVSSPSPLPWL